MLYALTVYPVSLALALVVALLFLNVVLIFVLLIFLFLPLSQTRGEPDYEITKCTDSLLGNCGLFICIILLYPVFFIAIMV